MKQIILLFIIPLITYSQNEKKTDSVFNHYFKVIEIELGQRDLMDYPNLIKEIDVGNGEKGYMNKYFLDAIHFFEKISKIKSPRKEKAQAMIPDVNSDTLLKWKSWYKDNENRIRWCEKKSKPKISFWRKLFG